MELATGREDLAPGADAAVTIGLVGAVGAATTGLTDWHKTDGKARKVGIVHGMLNLTATALYATSLVLRKRKQREAAIAAGLLGYAVSSAAAYLGGNLVYEQKVGTDHAERDSLPDSFVAVLPEEDLHEGQPVRVEANGKKVVLVRQSGRVYALAETCSHLGGPLAEGKLGDGTITCPWHGSTFCLEDGSIVNGPATYPQPCYDVRIRNGRIEVRAATSPAQITASAST
jgi:nitrite reductase/ring-hydroxylating ferredoxin subunit